MFWVLNKMIPTSSQKTNAQEKIYYLCELFILWQKSHIVGAKRNRLNKMIPTSFLNTSQT